MFRALRDFPSTPQSPPSPLFTPSLASPPQVHYSARWSREKARAQVAPAQTGSFSKAPGGDEERRRGRARRRDGRGGRFFARRRKFCKKVYSALPPSSNALAEWTIIQPLLCAPPLPSSPPPPSSAAEALPPLRRALSRLSILPFFRETNKPALGMRNEACKSSPLRRKSLLPSRERGKKSSTRNRNVACIHSKGCRARYARHAPAFCRAVF